MKDNIKVAIYFCVFVLFIVFAYIGYNKLLETRSVNATESEKMNKSKLPEFELYLENGEKVLSSSLIGKPLVINIWTSWCGYCDVEMPYFNEMYLKEKDNITFVMINATGDRDSKESAKQYIKESGYSFEIYYDINLDAIRALAIYSYPTTMFIDKEGYIVSTKVGMVTKEILQNMINRIK